MKPVGAFVERVLRQRRPKSFRASPGDAEMMRIAVELAAAGRPEAEPSAAFVERLRGELAGQLGSAHQPSDGPAPAAVRPAGGVLATRRGVVWAAGAAAAAGGIGFAGGLGLAGGSVAASGPGGAQSTGDGQVLRPESGTWQTVSTSAELPDGGVRPFETPAVYGFVGRANGQLFAVSGACTHLGCKLDLYRPARQLRCPCHTAAFTLTGDVIHHPRLGPLPPLPRLPVREANGVVQVLV